MKIGSLFSGVAGLDRAVESFFDAEVAWFVEFDAAPSKVLAHHYPGVPNYGDVTAVDWANVEPVDILTGGFPCQDVSLAGARRGLRDGTRSGLWSEYAKAIDILRPKVVVIENVRGLLSAQTIEEVEDAPDSELEPGSGGVGEPPWGDRPVLNAFGRVLGDLAELGYDAEWVGLRAADAGAPHNRYRVFVIAYPYGSGSRWWASQPATHQLHDAPLRPSEGGTAADAPSGGFDGWPRGAFGSEGKRAATPGHREGTALVADGDRSGRIEHWRAVTVRQEHTTPEHGSSAAAHTGGERLREHSRESLAEETGQASSHIAHGDGGLRLDQDWGPYQPAIERWQSVMGRVAPSPTRPDGRDGARRLNPELTEWMMGWPAGWVTGPAIGLSRNEQLKACGNGVVTQQAHLALSVLAQRRGAA